jgi:hypothetical protein
VEKYARDEQVTVGYIAWRMRFACWIYKATDTHSEYVIPIASPRQPLTRKCLNVALYVHCLFFSRVTEENRKMFLRGQPIMKPKYEEGICRIRSSIANRLFFKLSL